MPDLALRLLAALGPEQNNFNSTVQGMLSYQMQGLPAPERERLLGRLSDAWSWLESKGLIGPSIIQPPSVWQRLTDSGAQLREDPRALAKTWADERLAGDLHPALDRTRSIFALGDYETASFSAMKAVEVEVRRVSGLPNELIGVALMRKAFAPNDGPLADPDAEGGERQATCDMFAGAIGLYKNPASHRTVKFDDPVEAAEVIQLADLLLRIVARAQARLGERS